MTAARVHRVNASYYQQLASQVPPAELARAVARRASRAAQRLLTRPAQPSRGDLQRSFGARSEADFVERVLAPRQGWSDASRRASVRAAVESLPGARERALARANAAADRDFDIFGLQVRFGRGRPVDWSLDPLSGYRYPRVPWKDIPLSVEGRDPKYPWVMGRLDALVALGQGAWLSDGPEANGYVQELKGLLGDFLRDNPPGYGVHWTSPMEVALRAANIAQALVMVRDAPAVRDPDWLFTVIHALVAHVEFVLQHLEDQVAVPNNHLIANHLGIWVTGLLFPELPGISGPLQRAGLALAAEFRRQVHPDGVSFEGSVPYHRLVLEMATLALVSARQAGRPLGGDGFEERVERMFSVARAYCTSSGQAPQFGDNDSGRILPLRERDSLDHGYLAPLGAALFGTASLRGEADALPDEAAWLLGMEGAAVFERARPSLPPAHFSSVSGGLHVLRNDEAVLCVRAGPVGQGGVGGHSHNDSLSFELHLRGVPLFVDSGTGTYTRSAELRHLLRSTRAHNTLEVDGREQTPLHRDRPFAHFDLARTRVHPIQEGEGELRLRLERDGYGTAASPVVVERTFLLSRKLRAFALEDVVQGRGSHRLTSWLHLRDAEARFRAAGAEELGLAMRVSRAVPRFDTRVLELGPSGEPWAAVLFHEGSRPRLVETLDSPGYGQVRKARAVTWERERQLPAREGCVVLFQGEP